MKPPSPGTLSAEKPVPRIDVIDYAPKTGDVRAEVLAGLAKPQKALPCKFFYDARGSQLFDQICELPEYYQTRTELKITQDHAGEIAALVGARGLLVEYGSGSSLKTRVLLDTLPRLAGYVPIDISFDHLRRSAEALAAAYPGLAIKPVCADYTAPFDLPVVANTGRVVAYFPGSTIGNFEPGDAVAFLRSIRQRCGPGSGLLIGVDRKKDPALLHAAYNDAAGVTAAFNLNVLHRVNADLGAAIDTNAFWHHAFYNVPVGRMEMHLVSRRAQRISVAGQTFDLAEGESIHTENCYKYTEAAFHTLAAVAGYTPVRVWTDADARFGVHYLVAD